MPHQFGDVSYGDASHRQAAGERMPQIVPVEILDPGKPGGFPKPLARVGALEHIGGRSARDGQQGLAKHGVDWNLAGTPSLAAGQPDDSGPQVDMLPLESPVRNLSRVV